MDHSYTLAQGDLGFQPPRAASQRPAPPSSVMNSRLTIRGDSYRLKENAIAHEIYDL